MIASHTFWLAIRAARSVKVDLLLWSGDQLVFSSLYLLQDFAYNAFVSMG